MVDMNERRGNSDWATGVAAVATLVLVPLSLYVAGYFALGSKWDVLTETGPQDSYLRAFGTSWQAQLFRPAASVESFLTGNDVETIVRDH